jgi:F-type H+-transporting ATPase subunit gamma
MPSLIDMRRRKRSITNMRQIFRAMKMISASRLRKSQDRILQTRPYALELQKVTRNLAGQSASEAAHPLLDVRPERRVLLAVVSGDKGLCGSFNSNVLREGDRAIQSFASHDRLELLCLGKRSSDYYGRRTYPIRNSFRSLFRNVTYDQAREIAEDVSKAFTEGEYDAVYLVYNQFISVMTQKVSFEKLLPLDASDLEAGATPEAASDTVDYLYEPSPQALLEVLLPRFVGFQVYRVLLESQAAEHAARMTAMDAATKNAGELIDKLTLKLNRARQAAITTELIEVVSGANALDG